MISTATRHTVRGRKYSGYQGTTDIVTIAKVGVQAQKRLGSVGSDPKFAVAWKPPPQAGITVLKSISVNVGRSGGQLPSPPQSLCTNAYAMNRLLLRVTCMCIYMVPSSKVNMVASKAMCQ
jgi:hypothetical protein